MNLINPNSKNKKWEVLLKDMWKLLTLKKSCPDHISVRSVKIFVLGVCGISSQIVFETSEVESTPSTSTKESKISEEFVFSSSEQLNSIRSRFYEMVLHKLTYVKDLKSRSLKGIKEYKIESNQNLKKDFINPNSNIDSFLVSSSLKDIDTSKPTKVENHSRITFRKARLESFNVSQELNPRINTPPNDKNLQSSNPILSFSPRYSLDDIENCLNYSNLEFSSVLREPSNVGSVPILHLNVHIGDGIKQELYINNINTYCKEVEDFCKLYNVSENNQDFIINIVKDELQSSLTCIDEVDEKLD